MLMFGKSVTQVSDPLRPLELDGLYRMVTDPSSGLADQVRQLRSVLGMDPRQYRRLKTNLPYFVCGRFHPPVRKKEHFAYTSHFVIDIDHLSEFGRDVDAVMSQLTKDERVKLMYRSPGGDGVKVLFSIKDKITDSAYFTIFYKEFALRFGKEHSMEGMVDTRTNDVSRCCFISHEPDAYLNMDARIVETGQYVPITDAVDPSRFMKMQAEMVKEQQSLRESVEAGIASNPGDSQVSEDIFQRIRQKLNPLARARAKKEVYQPAALEEAMAGLAAALSAADIIVEKSTPIAYGRQVRVKAASYWAEINVFYGKRGFSVVKTTKTGSNATLADLSYDAIKTYFDID
jgi:hypothetical protein